MQISPSPSTGLIQALTDYFQAPAVPKPPAKTTVAEKVPEPESEVTIDRNARRGTYLNIIV